MGTKIGHLNLQKTQFLRTEVRMIALKQRIFVGHLERASPITNSGQVAIPEEIRCWLNLQPGDSVDFVIGSDGKVYLQPVKINVRELSGMLYEAGRKAVSLEEMETAISECVGVVHVAYSNFQVIRPNW